MRPLELIERLENREYTDELKLLYGADEKALYPQRKRYIEAIRAFMEFFPERDDVHIFSAPGRSEIGGNHTDHQHGCALAAAVNLDAVAVVAFREDGIIRLQSQGYGMSEVDLSDLSIHEEEKGKSIGIIRGIAARFAQMGVKIGGFDAYTISDVLSGSGLSSSAAFETLLGTIIDVRYNDCKAGEIEIAKIGQYAENVYFGKGSGLLDQMVCSVGGFVFIDFNDTENPKVEKHDFDFEKAGYSLCITDTKGSHSDLTDDYVAVPSEMKSVAAYFGKEYLRQVDDKAFFAAVKPFDSYDFWNLISQKILPLLRQDFFVCLYSISELWSFSVYPFAHCFTQRMKFSVLSPSRSALSWLSSQTVSKSTLSTPSQCCSASAILTSVVSDVVGCSMPERMRQCLATADVP